MSDAITAVQNVFRELRPFVLERAGEASHKTKADGSPVTDADVEIESLILGKLAKQFPNLPVFGEESGYGAELPGECWLVDPIDGTDSFMKGIPIFTNMAVLIRQSVAEAAVIYNPTTDDMYVAERGKGASKNGTRLSLEAVPLPEVAVCKQQFVDALNVMLEAKHITCRSGPVGIGHESAMVAEGQLAARFNLHSGGYTHDYAPGALLVSEAGGSIVTITDEEYAYDTRSFVACHPQLESVIRSQIEKLRELEGDWPRLKV